MIPSHIDILLWHYVTPLSYERGGTDYREGSSKTLVSLGLLDKISPKEIGYSAYEITERGRAYIDALCVVPLPEQIWQIPWERNPANPRRPQEGN